MLTAQKEYMKKALLTGQRVVLDELGAFQLVLKSRCFKQSSMTSATFDPSSYIDNVNVRFRPEAELIKYLRSAYTVKRVPSDLMA